MADGMNLATLWVPVVPETSQVGPAMEEAGKQAKGKFRDAIKDFGKTIHEDLDKVGAKAKDTFSNIGTHAKDSFKNAGKMAGDAFSSEFGKELQTTVGEELGKAIGGAVKDMPLFQAGAEYVQAFSQSTQQAQQALGGVRDAINAAKVGDFGSALQGVENTLKGVEPIAKTFGIDISGWEGPLGDVRDKSKALTDTYGALKGNIHDTAKGFTDLTNNSGRIAGGLNAIAAAAGPLAGTFAALDALMPGFDQHLNNVMAQIQGKQGFNLKDWINTAVPGTNLLDQFLPTSPAPPASAPPGPTSLPGIPDNPTDEWDPVWGPRPANGGLGWFGHGGGAQHPSTPGVPAAPSGFPGFPGMGTGTANNSLTSALQAAGVDPRMFPLLQGFAKTEGNNPSGVPTLGFTDSQAGSTLSGHAQALARQIQARQSVAGPFPAGGSPQEQASWMATVVGQNGVQSDWQGNAQPPRGAYVNSIVRGFGAMPASGAMPTGYNFYKDWYPGSTDSGSGGQPGGGDGSLGGRPSSTGGVGPTGGPSDPIYTAQSTSGAGASGGGSGAGAGGYDPQSQGQQLGQGMVNGVLQMFGLDGSVFKGFGSGKGLLDFGALKLGGGLLNWGMKMAQGGQGGAGGGGAGMPVGGDGAHLPGLGGLIPNIPMSPGAAVSAGMAPGGTGSTGGMGAGNTTVIHGDVNSGLSVTQNGVQSPTQELQWAQNSNRSAPVTVPNAGSLPAG